MPEETVAGEGAYRGSTVELCDDDGETMGEGDDMGTPGSASESEFGLGVGRLMTAVVIVVVELDFKVETVGSPPTGSPAWLMACSEGLRVTLQPLPRPWLRLERENRNSGVRFGNRIWMSFSSSSCTDSVVGPSGCF